MEDYIRQAGHLPGRTYDTMGPERKRQQEQSQPPEPETAGDASPDAGDDEIPEETVEAAKRRLGRGSGVWHSGS